MKHIIFLCSLFVFVSVSGFAQKGIDPDSAVMASMSKLKWMHGNWSGEGWVNSRDEQHLFTQSQSITTKIKGSIYLIEGINTDKQNTSLSRESFSVLSFDMFSKKYLMRAFKSDGKYVDGYARVERDGSLIWGFKIEGSPELRYTIKHVENKWYEVGEFSLTGTKWTKFYEMTLSKL